MTTTAVIAISILAFLLVIAVITVAVITGWYKDLSGAFDMQGEYIDKLEADKQDLLSDKRDLVSRNEELYGDNIRLSDAVRELREANKALTEKPTEKAQEADEDPMERLPSLPTNRYDAEPYDGFDPASEHYKLQAQCETETWTGLRYYNDGTDEYYCAALGGAYGATIGDAWRVTLKCGTTFNIIRGDFKHALPPEPDDFGDICRNYDKQTCMNVIEFIADFGFMPQEVLEAGGYHELAVFGGKYGDGGNIEKIEYLGRKWRP